MRATSYPSEAVSQIPDRLVEPKKRCIIAFIMSRCMRRGAVRQVASYVSMSTCSQIPENENGRCEQGGANKIDEPIPGPK